MKDLARSPKQIGNIIRRMRKRQKWSQGVLAHKAGVRQATISLIENGNPAMRLDTLLTLLAVLDLELQISSRTKSWEQDMESHLHGS